MGRDVQVKGWNAYVHAVGGNPEEAAPVADDLRQRREDDAAAWAHAIDVAVWGAVPNGPCPASPEYVSTVGRKNAGAAAGAAVVCVDGARLAWLSGRDDWGSTWADIARSLPAGRSGIVGAASKLVTAYQTATHGRWDDTSRESSEAERLARAARLAPFVIEATSLEAVAHLASGDLDNGVATARRAMRMARTEELAQPSYLAGMVLARARRLAGHFHLSSRILESLARVAPPLWATWLAWERSLAGAPPSESPEPAASLNRWIHAFETGRRRVLPKLAVELHSNVRPFASFREDAEALAAALGVATACPPSLLTFRHDVSPSRASGFEGLPRPIGPQVVAVVDVRPGQPAIRRLALSAPIAEPLICSSKPGRPEAVLAALALIGTARSEVPHIFRHVYGFDYVPERHANVFDVVLHRARALLEERGDVRREGDELLFTIRASFSVPDMSLQGSLSERVLHSLAIRARGSAKEIAEDLQMPLRTVQALLRELVDQGACSSERSARSVKYLVEDTTFKEPTALDWRRD